MKHSTYRRTALWCEAWRLSREYMHRASTQQNGKPLPELALSPDAGQCRERPCGLRFGGAVADEPLAAPRPAPQSSWWRWGTATATRAAKSAAGSFAAGGVEASA